MSSSHQTPATTRMFARVLGPFLIVVCTTAVVRTADMRAVISEFAAGALWRGACIVFAAIGLYLTYVGWVPATRPHAVSDHARPAHA